ncbi:MAG: ATP-dependent Clp protease ATP-binding subunit [Candidatus Levybacteria bacterium]|nr:ATP-dependent Clp protease ATP-binding subunit [Candidatus Levybacteria bacterium]
MIGNLFSKRKNIQTPQNTQQPVQQSVSQQVTEQVVGTTQISVDGIPIPVVPTIIPQTTIIEKKVVESTMEPIKKQEMSALTHLDPRSSQVLNHAQTETAKIKQQFIEPEQLLLGLLYDEEVVKLLGHFSVDVAKLTREIQSKEVIGSFTNQPTLSETSKQVFEQAFTSAKNRGSDFIIPEDILLTLFSASSNASNYLKSQGIEKKQLEEKLEKSSEFMSGKRSVLEKFGVDLTDQAKQGLLDPVVGRDREIERLVHILLRRTKNNPIIIGEAGVGKTAIIEGLAQKIVDGSAPKDLLSKKVIQLDMSSLVAGASHRGEFEERLRNVIKETQASSGTIILFVDEIHTLMGAGDSEGTMDASNIIKPFLARGQLQVIGTTTTAEYRKYFEKDKAFERRFQPIIVEEPSEEVAIEMLNVLKPKYENFHKVVITPEAIESAVHLSKRYIGERLLPDKAVDLLDEAGAEVRLQQSTGKRQDTNVKGQDIEKVVSSWTGIPITKLTENESEKLLHLEDMIHKHLINQENAVAAVAEAVRRGRIGLASANRPISSFIFLGPTGVGKTELAKTLAEILFGKQEMMIRLDMSEYMEKHEVAKLIGAPPGYVGYEEGGQLTEAVRAKPYSIVLLDEIEKAHPDVFNILLQVLEDGRLTDNKGNTISFKNTIIIATSNIGSTLIQQQLIDNLSKDAIKANDPNAQNQKSGEQDDKDKKFEELSKILLGELRKFFKPELLNRFDEVVIFEPLDRKNMFDVAKLGINATRKLLLEQKIDLEITQRALEQLAKEGYDPIYGARPLRRLIQSSIENSIALLIIGKTFLPGDKILIDFDPTKEDFVFSKAIVNANEKTNPAQQPVNNQEIPQVPAQPQPLPPQSPDGQPIIQDQIPQAQPPPSNPNDGLPPGSQSNGMANGMAK